VSAGVISLLYPTERQTDFLRACLWSGAEAQAAWQRWQETVGDIRRALTTPDSGSKALLALLHDAVRRNDLAVDASTRSLLMVARLADERRTRTYEEVCGRAFSALSSASIPFLVLKGIALGDTVYPEAALRHSHDIDVLVHPHDTDRSAAAVGNAGFIAAPSHNGPLRFIDACELPLELHVGVCRLRHSTVPLAEIWGRSIRARIGAGQVPTLGRADHLVHVLCQASCSGSRDTLTWVCDAWYLISRTAELDWDVILHTATPGAAALLLAGLLEFLAVHLRAPVPGFVLDGLSAAARSADRAAYEAILGGIRAGRRGRLRSMFRHARTNRERAAVLRWTLREVIRNHR
jgi:hypothetical protein